MFLLKRWYLLLLIFALILSLTVWSARTQLAGFILSSAMLDAGLTNITTNIQQLEIRQSKVAYLKFSLLTETGPLSLEAHDINISYKPEKVINGRIENLLIDRLIVDYGITAKTQDDLADTHKAIQPLEIISTVTHALHKYIFFNTLHVQNIILNGAAFGVLHGKTLQLKSTADDKSLYAEITLLNPSSVEQSSGLPQLVISKLTEDSLSAELRYKDTSSLKASEAAAKFELNNQNTELTGHYHISPQSIQHWLQAFTDTAFNDITGISETADVNGTLFFDFAPDKQLNDNRTTDKQISSTLTATSDKLVYDKYSADNAVIKLKLIVATDEPGQRIQLLNGSYVKADSFRYDNFSLNASHIFMVGELTNSTDEWLVKGGFRSDSFAANYQSKLLQIKAINARLTANSEKLEISGNFSPASVAGKFTFALDQDLVKHAGKLSIKPATPLDLDAENSSLSKLITPWPYPFDLLSGNIKLISDATWSQKIDLKLNTKIKLNDVGGYFNELVFSGLSFDHELEILPKLQSAHSSRIKLKHADSGITVSNIGTSFTLNTANTDHLPQLVIQGLHGEIFGGTFSADDFVFDPNVNQNRLNIKLTNIDLAEVVKTQQLEDITATGRIDGSIPVKINEHGLFIEDGAFINNIHSGTIRYKPTAGTEQLKQNPVTGIALDALKDFRYSHFSADVNYLPEGRLTINIQLKGTSPELDTHRPVHLNINTEQNLLSLLKSLRYTQGISENIDKEVRRLYEKNQK